MSIQKFRVLSLGCSQTNLNPDLSRYSGAADDLSLRGVLYPAGEGTTIIRNVL